MSLKINKQTNKQKKTTNNYIHLPQRECKISPGLDPFPCPSSPSATPPHSYPLRRQSKNVHCRSGCVQSPSALAGRMSCTFVLVARRPGQQRLLLLLLLPSAQPSSSSATQFCTQSEAEEAEQEAEGRRDVRRPEAEGGCVELALSEGA